jgi:hypothetical protein
VLPSKYEALSSNPRTTIEKEGKKNKKEKEKYAWLCFLNIFILLRETGAKMNLLLIFLYFVYKSNRPVQIDIMTFHLA